ncbi:MAG TPA: 1-acyl-sn-glycerol-3-phosphate acyltransferase [Candidatus Bacteroides merdigallinarum]|uniref:1-acyl-sn-glycerol-3-phosphate acyltransferase n=1 Tax=Candidatus Bacteroides merdigallinarum TaxID=2838473 RepID=A0A9D2E8E7_9BACE|nr:1-acyl-sn-glycerol-3-phosphate acyltransferase [Candidatus Bacteroides merdigallinarum]
MNQEFDEIRPYHDEELPVIYEELIADPAFRQVAEVALPGVPFEMLAAQMRACKTKQEFQVAICYNILKRIIREATQGVTFDNSAQPEKGGAYTYVSNHRDIVLDSGFLSMMLVEQGQDTVEIAIGDNLLIYPWIKKLVRINKSFIVQRALTMRQMLESSARMSRYMHHTIRDKHQSIWIAQREGRAKDSNDRTQESILKMMAMAGEGDIISRLQEMNIVPLAISYEYDPCDYLKAKEFQQKRDNPDHKKTTADDLQNMQTGILGYKGRVHLCTAPCLNEQLEALDRSLPKQELFIRAAELVDRGIFANYRLYPNNYVAADLLDGDNHFASHYTVEDKQRFTDYLARQLSRIDLPDKDEAFLREKLLQMYANPLRNQLSL